MIERVVEYSIPSHKEKSLLYTTSSDFSLVAGYDVPVSECAMRICDGTEFISRRNNCLQISSTLFARASNRHPFEMMRECHVANALLYSNCCYEHGAIFTSNDRESSALILNDLLMVQSPFKKQITNAISSSVGNSRIKIKESSKTQAIKVDNLRSITCNDRFNITCNNRNKALYYESDGGLCTKNYSHTDVFKTLFILKNTSIPSMTCNLSTHTSKDYTYGQYVDAVTELSKMSNAFDATSNLNHASIVPKLANSGRTDITFKEILKYAGVASNDSQQALHKDDKLFNNNNHNVDFQKAEQTQSNYNSQQPITKNQDGAYTLHGTFAIHPQTSELSMSEQDVVKWKYRTIDIDNDLEFLTACKSKSIVCEKLDRFLMTTYTKRTNCNNDSVFTTDDNVPDKYITDNYRGPSGIDELILPHSDFDYSVYESSLILNGSINPTYIKRIENGDIYIKYPIENPLKPMADVATLYSDVPVSTVEYIIKKAYSLWREKIFIYSGMEPDVALRDLVKCVYSNLELHFANGEPLYQAYRAARLFRWYAEMSILNNSEYMLKLNCRKVTPNYNNVDTFDIENIAKLTNLHLSNNLLVESVCIGSESSMVMECEKYHTVRFKSKMYVYDGEVTITINDKKAVYTDEYTELDLAIPIGKSSLKLLFRPLSTNGKIQFSQFEISDFDIEEYSIIYNGKVGESNRTIEYLIDTLVIAEDAIENVQANVGNTTPITNALDSMRSYFDIHHKDKEKGRRLINKFL